MMNHYLLNEAGRDFVVGDLHGCFAKLQEKLANIGFNEGADRLFSVGDLVDRGPQSEIALEWLDKPWFHAVRGNHEQMAIDAANGMYEPANYLQNGGAWFLGLTPPERTRFADAFSALPIALDIQTKAGLIGIVHADCPVADWHILVGELGDGNNHQFDMTCMWSRYRAEQEDTSVIAGVAFVIVGHTPMAQPTRLGNVLYIDTGAVFGGELTIVQVN